MQEAAVAGEAAAGCAARNDYGVGELAREPRELWNEVEMTRRAGWVHRHGAELLPDVKALQEPRRPGNRVEDLELRMTSLAFVVEHVNDLGDEPLRAGAGVDHDGQSAPVRPLPQTTDRLARHPLLAPLEALGAPRGRAAR